MACFGVLPVAAGQVTVTGLVSWQQPLGSQSHKQVSSAVSKLPSLRSSALTSIQSDNRVDFGSASRLGSHLHSATISSPPFSLPDLSLSHHFCQASERLHSSDKRSVGQCRAQTLASHPQVTPREVDLPEEGDQEGTEQGYTVVMKFGGSSVATAERMKEVANLVLGFPDERPIIVLSAMGKTTNNLLKAGDKAINCGPSKSCEISELGVIKQLHIRYPKWAKFCTLNAIDLADRCCCLLAKSYFAHDLLISFIVRLRLHACDDHFCVCIGVRWGAELLEELTQLLTGIALMKELTVRTHDYLVSFGERMSTRLFAAYLSKLGAKARQYDAFDMGFVTTDEFTNADILDSTYPDVASRLSEDYRADPAIAVVTGFIGKGQKTGAITTLGRGGSDLTATAIGKALSLREIQVWKDVDGVLTCDPGIHAAAHAVPALTFDEASELAFFGAQVLHPQSMRPARDGNVPVRVKNSYNPQAPGTLIARERDMSDVLLTSIVLKTDVTMLDIVSLRMLGQFGFLAKVSISLTLDPAKVWTRDLVQQERDRMLEELRKVATVNILQNRSIISLIGNVQKSSVFRVFRKAGTNVQMISQGASKV
eukprot:jgi/Mesen1/10576/ME000085S09908